MSRTLLLADDSLTIKRDVERTFADSELEVVSVDNGDDALKRLESLVPDLVIADIHMPGASGYEVAERAKEVSAAIPVLLLVGTFEPFEESDVAESGADGYMLKPFDSGELLSRVEALGGAPADASSPPSSPAEPTEPEAADDATEAGTGADSDGAVRGETDVAASDVVSAPAIRTATLSQGDVERIARRVVELITPDVVRQVVGQLAPGPAEAAVDPRLRQLEQEAE